jgi:hypothetical protein
MKTSLTFLALFLSAALPGAVAAELAGLDLPAAFGVGPAFGAFVMSLVVLTLCHDYADAAESGAQPARTAAATPAAEKSAHPLAA